MPLRYFNYFNGDRYNRNLRFSNIGLGRGNAEAYDVKVYKRPVLNMDLLNWWAHQLALQRALNEQLRIGHTIW